MFLSLSLSIHFSGGKGLGKGGAKRHRKVLRDNIQGNYMVLIHIMYCLKLDNIEYVSIN
jgi:hypothetical protein